MSQSDLPGNEGTESLAALEPVSVLLVDDHDIWRGGVKSLLKGSEFVVVGEASSGREALEAAREVRPSIVLLDIRMAGGDGFETLAALKAAHPRIIVLMLSAYDNPTFMARAVVGGASGYLLKGVKRPELLAALRSVAAGAMLLKQKDLIHALRGVGEGAAQSAELSEPLTQREIEVLRLIAMGLSNREIATELFLAEGTVKVHVEHIRGKLNVSDRVQAAVRATREGLIALPE